MDCDRAAKIAEEREPSEIALRAAENEVERVGVSVGGMLSHDEMVFAMAYDVQGRINKRNTREAAARTRRKDMRYE
jgi:hypothetical protein